MKKTMKRAVQAVLLLIVTMIFMTGCGKSKEVVVYTAVDEVFAEDIIKGFEQETGIKVKVVYDSEANKTTGLVNRIISEEAHPVCDVFWNNEFMQTIKLAQSGLLES
jgi:iron(III) transport system substrate-binding protein